jgi:alpha-mannosidase
MDDQVIMQKQVFNGAMNRAADWMERFEAELGMCRFLVERHPDKAKAWNALVGKASARVAEAAATGAASAIEAAVIEAERTLAPIGKAAKRYTVYCAGHAHIDMNWMWSWPETVSITHDSFATVLKLMDEFPEFVFTQSQASCYAIIDAHNPAMLAAIAQRVKEGRWEVVASHWVENDNNMAGPEALCRHLLYTRAYMQHHFGLSPEDVPINWSPDTFGHAATIPTYLVQGGIRYVYLHRPGGEGPKRPTVFRWQAPDGATVLVRNDMAFGYNGVIQPDNLLRSLRVTVEDSGLPITLYMYGVGDHGGGPTRRDLLRARELMRWPIFPTVKLSTARAFFEDLERRGAELPVLAGELNTEFTGCYTTQTLIKKANRFGETRLVDAEIADAVAWAACGRPYPSGRLESGWRNVLFK